MIGMQKHRSIHWTLVIATFLLVFSSASLVWILLPEQVITHEILIDPFDFESSGNAQIIYRYPVQNTLTFTWPEDIKLGGQGKVTLEIKGKEIINNPDLEDERLGFAEEYNLVFESRLDLSFSTIWPVEGIKKPVNSLHETDFEWETGINNSLDHIGNIWVYINFIPKNGGDSIRKTISAVPVEVKTVSLFGISKKILIWVIPAGFLLSFSLSGFAFLKKRKAK